MARPRRDRTEVSCVIKYLVFGFNVIFWIIGLVIFIAGIWAWMEKDMFRNIGQVTQVPIDPAFFFIVVGAIMYFIGFTGCLGALRENTCLLLVFCTCIGIIFFLEVAFAVAGFVYKGWVSNQIETQLKKMIVQYRDDIDLQNLIDWVQSDWLKCCGVGGPNDWDSNMYFNCSAPSRERCGVPFSCCLPIAETEEMQNTQCGFDTRDQSDPNVFNGNAIYLNGCLKAGETWINRNLIPVAGVAVGVALLQILGICFAQNLRSDIFAQKAKWG